MKPCVDNMTQGERVLFFIRFGLKAKKKQIQKPPEKNKIPPEKNKITNDMFMEACSLSPHKGPFDKLDRQISVPKTKDVLVK